MKKVNSLGKKVMSTGLAACLLATTLCPSASAASVLKDGTFIQATNKTRIPLGQSNSQKITNSTIANTPQATKSSIVTPAKGTNNEVQKRVTFSIPNSNAETIATSNVENSPENIATVNKSASTTTSSTDEKDPNAVELENNEETITNEKNNENEETVTTKTASTYEKNKEIKAEGKTTTESDNNIVIDNELIEKVKEVLQNATPEVKKQVLQDLIKECEHTESQNKNKKSVLKTVLITTVLVALLGLSLTDSGRAVLGNAWNGTKNISNSLLAATWNGAKSLGGKASALADTTLMKVKGVFNKNNATTFNTSNVFTNSTVSTDMCPWPDKYTASSQVALTPKKVITASFFKSAKNLAGKLDDFSTGVWNRTKELFNKTNIKNIENLRGCNEINAPIQQIYLPKFSSLSGPDYALSEYTK